MTRAPLVRWGSAAARVLLLVGLTSAVATLRSPNLRQLLAALVLLLPLTVLGRVSPARLLRRALLGLGVVLMFVLPLLIADHALRAALLGARSMLALLIALSLAETLALAEVAPALAALGVPEKLASVVATALSQLGLLRDSGERIVLARKLRGARGANMGPDVVAALLARSAERAERMALAADLRGRDLTRAAKNSRLSPRDCLLLLPGLALGVGLHCWS
ncbi:MAG TPA: CbiQ family ECF transporter T component [Polyangiaceae bacterium]|nr:CbiQ family ECF transporter T component [Polyangiaceae bacterium]